MLLTDHTVVDYLVGRRLLTRASLVVDQIQVQSSLARHSNYTVQREYKGGFFVKQVKSWDPTSREALAREAAWYRLVAGFEEASAVRPLLPHFSLWDPERSILVLDLLTDAQPLHAVDRQNGINSPAVALQIARMLATLHAHNPRAWKLDAQRFRLPFRFPGALTLDQRTHADLSWMSGGEQEMMRALHETDFSAHLSALRTEWKQDCIIHSDVRWSNLLLLADSADSGDPVLKLVDWELVDCGERAWDIGGVLQSWLSTWIESMPDSAAPPNELVRAARWPLADMKPAIATFWKDYVRATRLNKQTAHALLLRSTKYAAARLMQSTLEAMHGESVLTNRGLCGLQLAMNLLNDPTGATSNLLGLD